MHRQREARTVSVQPTASCLNSGCGEDDGHEFIACDVGEVKGDYRGAADERSGRGTVLCGAGDCSIVVLSMAEKGRSRGNGAI